MTSGLGLPLTQPTALIASGFGIGLMPGAPGTWASLAALPCAWGLCWCCGTAGLAAATAVAFLAGWWTSEQVARTSPVADPGWVVVDEIAGQWLVLLFVPQRVWFYGAAFAAFRLFDIWKPFPVSWCDRNVRGGLGIMLDDVAAAIYAAMLIAIAEGVAGVRP